MGGEGEKLEEATAAEDRADEQLSKEQKGNPDWSSRDLCLGYD